MNQASPRDSEEGRIATLKQRRAERAGAQPSKTAVAVRVAFAAAISVAFVIFFATRIHPSELFTLLRQMSAGWLLVGVVVLGVANAMRAERFRLLEGKRHSFSYWWVVTQLYNFTTSTLPGGLGEIVAAYFFRRSNLVGWISAFRALIVARLFDLAAILSIFVAAMCALGLAWTAPSGAISSGVGAALAISALILLIPRTQALALTLLMRLLPQRFPLFARARNVLHTVAEVSQTTDRRTSMLVVMWSVALGMFSSGAVMALLSGAGTHLSLLQSCASYGLYVILQLIPVQGIAGIGAQSARWAIALALVGVAPQEAMVDSVALYVFLYGIVALWAICAALVGAALRLKQSQRGLRARVGGESPLA